MAMSSAEELLYAKDSQVWIPHRENVWTIGTIQKDYIKNHNILEIKTATGSEHLIQIKNDTDLPPLCNPSILSGQRNLVSLSYLHEPAVLYNLQVRFCDQQSIYTYCGIILVAINPYAELPLYGSDIIRNYRGHSIGELDPHIFAVAEDAYAKLEREKRNISIIVSGESGAGKTVSAKYAMRYFAVVGGSESETKIEKKVLASSPIMEAIGNAKTTRNDNSSRFGKFTKLLFRNKNEVMKLMGATMQTYLLEKSRVVFQALGERNYHIFYQICAGRAGHPYLDLDEAKTYKYLNYGESTEIHKISDLEQFNETKQALNILGFNQGEVKEIFKILAAILHLGNIKFLIKKSLQEADQDECDILQDDKNLTIMSGILEIDKNKLRQWLITRQIESVADVVLIPNNIVIAEARRDALAKHLYEKLFHYIVNGINMSLNKNSDENCFIGVLDIYGFETFECNSFEQFCINYANEKLQQQFNQHVFKLEQDEYLKEGITWTMIDFYDNQPCIDLIESRLGILDLLDEECKMPRGSDESWAGKLNEKCGKYKHFETPRFGKKSFLVKHFSDTVEYDVNGFLEKNRDTVSKELVNVIHDSKIRLCGKIIELDQNMNELKSSGGRTLVSSSKPLNVPTKQHKKTVGSQFRESLSSLISTLHQTMPHYVRCIKPNETKTAFKWEARKVVQQLRACGVLETVRISAAGFPSRWKYQDFYLRYRLLYKLSASIQSKDIKKYCIEIVKTWIADPNKYRFGHRQIFFRAGQVAYLEQIRSNIRRKYIIKIQSYMRKFVNRRRYLRLKKITLGIQSYSRGLLARRKAKYIRENRAAIILQKNIRGWLCRQRFSKLKYSVSGIQQYARGLLARRRFKIAMDNYKAVNIQRFCRGYLARIAYKKKLKQIKIGQAAIRAFLARRLFKKLRVEARTLSHMQKQYTGLENKIISMQQVIDELNKENSVLKTKSADILELRSQLELKKKLESEMKNLKDSLVVKENSLISISKQLENERDEKMSLLEERDREFQEWNTKKKSWGIENDELKKQISDMIERAKFDILPQNQKATKYFTDDDSNEVHHAYQRAIKEKETLENENNNLVEEVKRLRNSIERNSYSPSNQALDEDHGYGSAKNTLEQKPKLKSHEDKQNWSLTLRLKKILEEEQCKRQFFETELDKLRRKTKPIHATEDSLRISELEVENGKLRHAYESLRVSIEKGTEDKELEKQYLTLREELKRQREECIQLRAVLAEQTNLLKVHRSLPTFNSSTTSGDGAINSDLTEAFQALKLINRQLESELEALNDENNAKLGHLTKQLEDSKNENETLNHILQTNVDNDDLELNELKQVEQYLRNELEKSLMDYVHAQENNSDLQRRTDSLTNNVSALQKQLREHGIMDNTVIATEDIKNVVAIKKKAKSYQGIFKYRNEDLDKILQRLVTDLTPKTAITLLPGLPAYIIFMCIRYTDLVNADNLVKDLLSTFLRLIKPSYKKANTSEVRVLWMVNMIVLLNLLKQYGGIDEYLKYNTETQHQQQLNNFDLSEYRSVVYETIIKIHNALIIQVQDLIKPYIVPAILDHDEISKSHRNQGKTQSLDISPDHHRHQSEPKSLANQLEHFYKQFQFFGLEISYTTQIFKQLMYYISAVAMNSLMLRGELCNWKTGMKIRYNISCLEDWARKKNMPNDVIAPTSPLNQVSSLLQSRKTEQDVQSMFELCSDLTTAQVQKILKSYRPDDCENSISNSFIEKLTEKLNQRQQRKTESDAFTINENYVYPLMITFEYSDKKLEDIELPPLLRLDDLLCKI